MKTIEQISAEVKARQPDAECIGSERGYSVWWNKRTNSTFVRATPEAAWEQALHFIKRLPKPPPKPSGMRPETLALIQAEIEHIDQFLSLPPESESYRQVHIAMKNQRVFIDKLLKSERQR